MLLFSLVHHSVKLKKLFPMIRIDVEYGHQVCPISLQLWDDYLFLIELKDSECDQHQVIIIFPFSKKI